MRKYVEVGFNYAGGVEEAKKRKDDPEYDDVLYVDVPSYHENKRDLITLNIDEAEIVGHHLLQLVAELRK